MLNRFGLLLYTKLFGKFAGVDTFKNNYYFTKHSAYEKRWVVYNGIADASKIPAEWYGWLHFLNDAPPSSITKNWIPNITGTHFPKKHISSIENIPQITLKCYTKWIPNK